MASLRVNHLGKAFKRYERKWGRMAEWFGLGSFHEKKWILQDVSFEVSPGESVGIVGINGAGKSTLLKIITGTTRPTTGAVELHGRVSALLELGMGFHPDFTGRQNCYMAGQIQGISTEDITRVLPEIESFAEIGDYFDQPVRTYSSGMQVRLAFSVATAIRPDILIVDEALSVGDLYFQHRCMQRIRSFKEQGTTLLFVSHVPESVCALCDRGILLEGGRIAKDADAASVMDYYRASQVQRCDLNAEHAPASELIEEQAELTSRQSKAVLARKSIGGVSVDIIGEKNPIHSGDDISIRITASFDEAYGDPHLGLGIRNKMGVMIYEANTYTLRLKNRPVAAGETLSVEYKFMCNLIPGTYELVIGVADGGYDRGSFERALFFDQSYMLFEVMPGDNTGWSGLWDIRPEVTFI
jgi:lipopolysaccharide transport system ATP-binding protein